MAPQLDQLMAFPANQLQPIGDWENTARDGLDEAHITTLAESFTQQGEFHQPPKCYFDHQKGLYVPCFGFHRFAALLKLELAIIKAIVTGKPPTANQLREWQLIENLTRLEMKPMERARAIIGLRDANGETNTQTAQRLGIKSVSALTDYDGWLLLPREAQDALDDGSLSPSAASWMARCDDTVVRDELFLQRDKLTRDQFKAAVQKSNGGARKYQRQEGEEKSNAITLKGETAVIRIEPGKSPDELYTLIGRAFRAAEVAKKANDIKLFGSKLG